MSKVAQASPHHDFRARVRTKQSAVPTRALRVSALTFELNGLVFFVVCAARLFDFWAFRCPHPFSQHAVVSPMCLTALLAPSLHGKRPGRQDDAN